MTATQLENAPVTALRARWVLPATGSPIQDGVVRVQGNRVVSVGEQTHSGDDKIVDLNEMVSGAAVLLPGLINAHTHLEFAVEAPLGEPNSPITEWIPQVMAWRRARDENNARGNAAKHAAISSNLQESMKLGVSRVGEIATSDFQPTAYEAACRTDAFLELIAISPAQNDDARQRAFAHLESTQAVRRGLSPHAPYTVNWELLEDAIDLSERTGARLQMHLAESQEELEFMAAASGPFREMLERVGAWTDSNLPLGMRPLDYLERLAKSSGCVIAHGNFLDDDEIEYLAQQRDKLAVAFCPRTHSYFGYPPHPLPRMLAAGVNVALGTDSLASNPNLSVFEEMRFVAHHGLAQPEDALRMATVNGAEALADSEVGAIAAGKKADLTVVRGPESVTSAMDALFDQAAEVSALMIDGDWVAGAAK